MTRLVLALNAGSSSLKAALFEPQAGAARRLGSWMGWAAGPNAFAAAVDEALDWAAAQRPGGRIVAVGHRIVHGGTRFAGPVQLTAETLRAINALRPLAPLHQPQAVDAILAATVALPRAVQTASFDTAFHRDRPGLAGWLGLTRALHHKGMRRYGFHGLSYRYVSRRLASLAPDLARGRVLVAHLGSGASLCALSNGASMDTSMGFSPLDGLMMATRPGALDPGAVLYLLQHEKMTPAEVEDLLYHRSGLLGVSGESGDMRTLLACARPEAREAVELFAYRAAREAGALASVLGGIDGLAFTGGIGEQSPQVRAAIAARLSWLGLALDDGANVAGGEGRISAAGSKIEAWVVPTDEEQIIAEDALEVLATS